METFLIPTRKIPETKKFGTEATEIRDIDVVRSFAFCR